jgi:sorting nexin-8
LPIPSLGSYSAKNDAKAHSEFAASQAATNLVDQDHTQISHQGNAQKTAGPAPGRLISRQSYGYTDSDPWAVPDLHKGHSYPTTNGTGVVSTPVQAPPQRTTSTFTTTSHTGTTNTGKSAPTRESASRDSAWGGYNTGSGESFRDSGLGGFGDSSGGDGDGDGNNTTAGGAFIAPRITPTGTDEVITVQSLPEKEGVFLFQHRNYQITSARRGSKVIRRYSDFAWLLDCLHKRYPFRQLPLLPPKRVASK